MIKLPDLFEKTLKSAPSLEASVRKTLDLFEPWLEQSGMPFFPGFTDHSPRHINDVLSTAASLISDQSRELISPEDVVVLCIAVLLHDCGMHLTQDGFRALIADSTQPIVAGLGDLPWSQLWKDFLSEANRFGQDKLIAIFGDSEPINPNEIDLENLTERDCLLIGEFVRRHHTRLAHEIALKGVPAKNTEKLELIGFENEIKDLSGLVARSHGMSIRSTFDYLKERYGLIPEYRHIKTPYLMAVLRIADYIQVKSERAIKALLSVKELRSPISRQEWLNHFAVRDVSLRHNDPEAFYVHAMPSDVKTYLKLASLFKDIQREMDESWATIGEVYGRLPPLSSLGLTIRRIRSNIDSIETFSRNVSYIPIKAGFDSSGPDLLKLLVGPLYNYEYSVGIRELLQNAVDACKEVTDLLKQKSHFDSSAQHESDVIVEIHEAEDGTGWVRVIDRGVGMTLETVTRYFLIAGASFRNSDLWKQQHIDQSGNIRVMRGGRFGVGALAAFMLGDEISVKTRHINRPESDGLNFTARIDDPVVELRRCTAPAGTTIEVRIANPKVFAAFRPHHYFRNLPSSDEIISLKSWDIVDWFAQETPKLLYRWNGYNHDREATNDDPKFRFIGEFRPDEARLVPTTGVQDSKWRALDDPGPYKLILWHYQQEQKIRTEDGHEVSHRLSDEVTVNGIRVKLNERRSYYHVDQLKLTHADIKPGPQYYLLRPSIAIFDPLGICPINLQRSSVSFDRMDLDVQIAKSVLFDYLRTFKEARRNYKKLADFYKLCNELTQQRFIKFEGQLAPICATSSGVFLATPKVFSLLKVNTVFFIDSDIQANSFRIKDLLKKGEALMLRQSENGTQNNLAWFRAVFKYGGKYTDYYSETAGFPLLESTSSAALIPQKKWKLVNTKGKVSRELLSSLNNTTISDSHEFIALGRDSEVPNLWRRAKEILNALDAESEVAAWYLDAVQPHASEENLLFSVWNDVFNGPYLPLVSSPSSSENKASKLRQKAKAKLS